MSFIARKARGEGINSVKFRTLIAAGSVAARATIYCDAVLGPKRFVFLRIPQGGALLVIDVDAVY